MNKNITLSILISGFLLITGCGSGSSNPDDISLKVLSDLNITQSTDNMTEATAEDMVLAKNGKTLYIADGSAGLKIVDVSISDKPKLIASYDDPSDADTNKGGFARRITISHNGETVFIADGLAGLKIIDVKDPRKPLLLGKLDTAGFSHGIAVSSDDKTVYIADNGEDGGAPGLRVIDVTDLNNPALLKERDEQWATQVALSPDNKIAYITDKKAGILAIDIDTMSTLGKFPITDKGISADIVISTDGKKAYVANKKTGIKILDISDPAHIKLLSKFDTDGFNGKSIAKSIALSKDGTKLYVANRQTGVEVIDVKDSLKPKLLTTLTTTDIAEDVLPSLDDTKLYVANGKAGLEIIEILQ